MNKTDSATPPSSSAQQAPALRPITAQETAAQLRCPSGKLGLEFGRVMNLRNLSMIVGGVRQLDLQPGQQILELGAGDGGVLGYVLSRAQEIRYTGLDISPTMVEAARRFNTPFIEAGLASYVLYDGGRLPLRIPMIVTDDSGIVTAQSGHRDRCRVVRDIACQANCTIA